MLHHGRGPGSLIVIDVRVRGRCGGRRRALGWMAGKEERVVLYLLCTRAGMYICRQRILSFHRNRLQANNSPTLTPQSPFLPHNDQSQQPPPTE